MDKFLTFPNSRIPIWQDDFAFIQNSAQNGIALAIKSMLPPAMRTAQKVIIYGCEVTKDNNEYTTTAGLVMINGEVLEVQGSTENFEDTPTFVVDSSFDSTGDRADSDGNSRRCYNIRRAKLGLGAGSDIYWMIPRFNQRVTLYIASSGLYPPGNPNSQTFVNLTLNVINGIKYLTFKYVIPTVNPTDGKVTPIYSYISLDFYKNAYSSLFFGVDGNTIRKHFNVFIPSLNAICPAVLTVTNNPDNESMLVHLYIYMDNSASDVDITETIII